MKCIKCGKDAKEGAQFCPSCGTRLDGNITCKQCGAINEKDNVFCVACGKRIDGKNVCPKCGEENEGDSAFCISCGEAMTAVAESKSKEATGLVQWDGAKASKICKTISGVALMVGVLFSMLFVWFMKVRIAPNSTVGMEVDIYYFFGRAWEDLKALTTAIVNINTGATVTVSDDIFASIKTGTIVYNVFGAVLSAAILIGVTGFGLKAIIDYLSSLANRKEDKSEKSALRCLFCFLGGGFLFLSFNGIVSFSNGVENGTRGVGTMTAGFVLVLIALGIKLICKLIAKAPDLRKKENFTNLIFSLIGLVFSVVLLCLAHNVAIAVTLKVPGATTGTGTTFTVTDIGAGFFRFNDWAVRSFGLLALPTTLTATYSQTVDAIGALNVYGAIAQLATFAFVALTVWLLSINMRKVEGEQKAMTRIVLSSVLILLSVLVLIFSILSCNAVQDMITSSVTTSTPTTTTTTILEGEYGVAISCIVFSVLSLVVEIVRVYLEKIKIQEQV